MTPATPTRSPSLTLTTITIGIKTPTHARLAIPLSLTLHVVVGSAYICSSCACQTLS